MMPYRWWSENSSRSIGLLPWTPYHLGLSKTTLVTYNLDIYQKMRQFNKT